MNRVIRQCNNNYESLSKRIWRRNDLRKWCWCASARGWVINVVTGDYYRWCVGCAGEWRWVTAAACDVTCNVTAAARTHAYLYSQLAVAVRTVIVALLIWRVDLTYAEKETHTTHKPTNQCYRHDHQLRTFIHRDCVTARQDVTWCSVHLVASCDRDPELVSCTQIQLSYSYRISAWL